MIGTSACRLLLLAAYLVLCGCSKPASSPPPPSEWTTAYWFWPGGFARPATADKTLETIYFHSGVVRNDTGNFAKQRWVVYSELPRELPPAHEYWLVFRFERQSVPDLQAVPLLLRRLSQIRESARQRHLNVAGVQLDIDSPTGKLPQYARFLREVARGLPSGMRLSITALLDWFRDGTAVDDVIEEVHEFVPQFYDLADQSPYGGGIAIASKVDAARWAPRFNRFRKPFRIGISTFGRARFLPRGDPSRRSAQGETWYRDLKPFDISTNPSFQLQAERNEAGELVLNYRAVRATNISYHSFDPGDALQFILSTPETVRAAAGQAKRIGGYCAGISFFRWPGVDEDLVMEPDMVLRAAAGLPPRPPGIEPAEGHCASVHCVDIYLTGTNPLAAQAEQFTIKSSTELEYFLPEQGVPVIMSGPKQLTLTLPPYCGRGRLLLGHTVTLKPATFAVARSANEEKR
ncbi:MAG: DUF3142 domain-containing protein [Acidobacteria bacterium]|nr:DUF3142 domain-containing protein [Acidobacteriota bacterium]